MKQRGGNRDERSCRRRCRSIRDTRNRKFRSVGGRDRRPLWLLEREKYRRRQEMYLLVGLLPVAALPRVWQSGRGLLISCRCSTRYRSEVGRAESCRRLVAASRFRRRRKTCRDTVSSSAGPACLDGNQRK